jgi:3-oxoacyl-[acyl-carrier protein] reductase
MFDTKVLKGKNIAITGASKGIGREVAILLNNLGANLLLGSREEFEVSRLISELGVNAFGIGLDVTDEDSVSDFTKWGIKALGEIDVLINCAGYGSFGSILDLPVEEFDRMINVNLRGAFLTSKYFGKHMVSKGSGRIINLVSIAGREAISGCSGYSASKFGVFGLSKVMQVELRSKGVYVTSVLPGAVNSSFWDSMEFTPDKSKMIPTDVIAKHIVSLLCQPEGAVVEEVVITPPLGVL